MITIKLCEDDKTFCYVDLASITRHFLEPYLGKGIFTIKDMKVIFPYALLPLMKNIFSGTLTEFDTTDVEKYYPAIENFDLSDPLFLRDEQYDIVKNLANNYRGLVQISTGCLSGDTKVSLLNGELSMKELYDSWIKGQRDFYTICAVPEEKRLDIDKIVDVYISGTKSVYKITLDNGQSIKCTSNHQFLSRDNVWCSIDKGNLIEGMSLMPFYQDMSSDRYRIHDPYNIYNKHMKGEQRARFVMQCLGCEFKKRWHIHHINNNHHDDRPENLVYVSLAEHSRIHMLEGHSKQMQIKHQENLKKHPEIVREMARKLADWNSNCHPALRKDITRQLILDTAKRTGIYQLEVLAVMLKCSRQRLYNVLHMNEYEFCDYLGYKRRITNKKYKPTIDEVLAFVKKFNNDNFDFLRNALGTTDQHLSKVIHNNLDCWNKRYYNHKIIKIEKLSEPELVYDITTAKHHNFALVSGIFAHNSGKGEIIVYLAATCKLPGNKLVLTNNNQVAKELELRFQKYKYDLDQLHVRVLNPISFMNSNRIYDEEMLAFLKDVSFIQIDELESVPASLRDLIKLTPNYKVLYGYSASPEKRRGLNLSNPSTILRVDEDAINVLSLAGFSASYSAPEKPLEINIIKKVLNPEWFPKWVMNSETQGALVIKQKLSQGNLFKDNTIFKCLNSIIIPRKQAILFIPYRFIEHGDMIYEYYSKSKLRVIQWDGQKIRANFTRKQLTQVDIKKLSEQNKFDILLASSVANRGVDFRNMYDILLFIHTQYNQIIQLVGRVSRNALSEKAIIWLIHNSCDNTPFYTQMANARLGRIRSAYKQAEVIIKNWEL